MASNFFNTIILLGSIQGFIVSSLLLFSKKQKYSNRLLSALVLLISLASFNLYASYMNWFGSNLARLMSNFIPLVIVMPLGPLIYFYIQALQRPAFRIPKRQRLQFSTIVIDLVPSAAAILFVVGVMIGIVSNRPGPWGVFIDNYNVYADIPRWLSLSLYLWASARQLGMLRPAKDSSDVSRVPALKWLRQLVVAFTVFQLIWLVYLVPYVIPRYTDWMLSTFDWYPLYIPMAVLTYWVGIKGYIVSQHQKEPDKKQAPPLPADLVNQVSTALKKAMEEDKIFLQPHLNLAITATLTGFPPKIISAVINQHLGKSFNEFVNEYRIRMFTEQILLPEMQHLTIAGIAQECGFNSPATFQRVFRELTGKSPSELRKTATVSA